MTAVPKEQDEQERDEEVNPRWIDWHFPDVRLVKMLGYRRFLRRNSQRSAAGLPKRPLGPFYRACNRWMLDRVHCHEDGQCVLRNGHRGGCTWGDDGEDD